MSAALLAVLTNGPAILSFIQSLVAVGTDAVEAWDLISPMVTNDVAPTPEQWAAIGVTAAQDNAEVQALGTSTVTAS